MSVSLIDGHIDDDVLTDEQIIKALEHCSADDSWCNDCPYENICTDTFITKFALDLINRLKAEIERLKDFEKNVYEVVEELRNKIKAEAKKEFAEELIYKIVNTPTKFESTYYMYREGIAFRQNEIIDIIKEMVGDDK